MVYFSVVLNTPIEELLDPDKLPLAEPERT